MTILDATIVNIAIPTLQVDLKAGSYADISWVVTGYMLAQGAVIPMAGWATDRFGTKRLYLITIALFTLASMACGVAQNLPELVIFRVLQGLGGGMLMPIGMTIIMRAVGPQNMGRVMGIFGIPMLLAPAVGPGARWMVRAGFLVAPHLLRQRSDRAHRVRLGVAVPHGDRTGRTGCGSTPSVCSRRRPRPSRSCMRSTRASRSAGARCWWSAARRRRRCCSRRSSCRSSAAGAPRRC